MTDTQALIARLEAATGRDVTLGRELLRACGKGHVSPLYRWLDPTASIDAALTLVPEGASWDLRWKSGDKKAWLTFYPPGDAEDDYFHVWEATTPALAICIAALRAIEARQQ